MAQECGARVCARAIVYAWRKSVAHQCVLVRHDCILMAQECGAKVWASLAPSGYCRVKIRWGKSIRWITEQVGVLQRHTLMCTHWPLVYTHSMPYGVASISRPLKIIGLFCKRALSHRLYSAKDAYNFKEPTSRSHPIVEG